MRAKLQVNGVVVHNENYMELTMNPVCGKAPFGPNGESEDNTYSMWTPSGELKLTITNPNLFGKFKQGQKFYADFTEAAE